MNFGMDEIPVCKAVTTSAYVLLNLYHDIY